MRSDLANVEGISDIHTDIKTQSCQFKLANKDLDLKAKLDELAQSNEHIKGFQQKPDQAELEAAINAMHAYADAARSGGIEIPMRWMAV